MLTYFADLSGPALRYVAMRIPRVKIADTFYSLNESIVDAHISLGRWHILDAKKFEIQYRKAYRLLGKSGGLHVKAR